MPIERCRAFFSGRVQGVGFRMTARRLARPFDLAGFAKNLPDGRVEVQAQGESARIDGFLEALSREMAGNIVHVERDVLDPDPDLGPAFDVRL